MPVWFGAPSGDGHVYDEEMAKTILHYTDLYYLNPAYLQADG